MKRLVSGLACWLLAASAHAELPITGRLTGFDDEPMRNAFVRLQGPEVLEQGQTDVEGRFRFTVGSPGVYWLWSTGVHHKTLLLPLLVFESIDVGIRLAAAQPVAVLDSLRVIGDFNAFADDENAARMEPQTDGTYVAVIRTNADTLAYQLLGVQSDDQPIAGTQAERYVFDAEQPLVGEKSGKYAAVVQVEDGVARIVFEPARLPHSDRAAEITFPDANGLPARIAGTFREIQELQQPFIVAVEAHRRSKRDPREFAYDWSATRRAVREQIDAEPPGLVREFLLLSLVQLGSSQADSALGQQVFAEVPPSSVGWSLLWGSPFNTLYTVARLVNRPEVVDDYVQKVLESHTDPLVLSAFIYHALVQAHRSGDSEARRLYYTRLINEFDDSFFAQRARAQFARDEKVQPGKPVPEFAIADLEDSQKIYSPASFPGQVYLIDFWAVWCGPCIAEMKHLHQTYERYKDEGFTILSISLDRSREQVDTFRKQRWPMPWNHAFAEGSVRNEISAAFDVVGIPKPILIGRDGKIVATQIDLRGERLMQTVGKFLAQDDQKN